MMRSVISILVVAGSLAGFGCVSSRPVHYYSLGTVAPPLNQGKPDGLILLVGNIATPEGLVDGRIRYRSGSNEVGAYEYHRWTERPGSMVRNALLRALRDSGKYQRVLESGSSVSGDYLVRGKLDEFDEVDGSSIQTRISLHVELLEHKSNQNVWDRLIVREEPVSGKSVVEVVQSLDRNLQHVLGEALAEIDKFLVARHARLICQQPRAGLSPAGLPQPGSGLGWVERDRMFFAPRGHATLANYSLRLDRAVASRGNAFLRLTTAPSSSRSDQLTVSQGNFRWKSVTAGATAAWLGGAIHDARLNFSRADFFSQSSNDVNNAPPIFALALDSRGSRGSREAGLSWRLGDVRRTTGRRGRQTLSAPAIRPPDRQSNEAIIV